jgi:tetratricopeptide (TPR) repeat protein
MNRLDEAKAVLNEALQRKTGSGLVHEQLGFVAFEQGDQPTFAKERALAETNPQEQFDFLQFDASLAAAHGQLKRAKQLFSQLGDKAQSIGLSDAIPTGMANEAMANAMEQNRSAATAGADAALKKSQSPTLLLSVADVYARSGEDAKGDKLLAQAAAQRPDDEFVQSITVPVIQAVLAMNHHDPQKALQLMRKAEPYDRGTAESLYTRAAALLMAGQASDAVQEFQRTLSLKGYTPTDLFVSLAQLGLARSYIAEGDKAKGRTAYQDFLGAWKDADPDVPLLKQALAEYAKVQ